MAISRVRQDTFAEKVQVRQENITAPWGSARSALAEFFAFRKIILLNLLWGVILRFLRNANLGIMWWPQLEGREPPLTLRQEKLYLYFGHLFPCTPGPFFPVVRRCLMKIVPHRAGPVLQEFGLATTGWRLALHLCSPSPALGLRVVVYLVTQRIQAL